MVYSINTLENLDLSELSSEETLQLKTSLQILFDETQGSLWERKTATALSLMDLLDVVVADNKITSLEYKDWMTKFKTRDLLDRSALNEFIRRLKMREIFIDPQKNIQL